MRAVLALIALAGCDFVFRIDHVDLATNDGDVDGATDDTGDNCDIAHQTFAPVSCSSSFGTVAVEQSELASHVIGDPTLRGDGLEIFFTTTGGNPYTIASARRDTVTDPFVLVGAAPFAQLSASDTEPSVDAKGEYVAFLSTRGGTERHAFLAHRACTTWDLRAMPGLESTSMTALDLSWDALTLYYVDGAHQLFQSDRVDIGTTFGPSTLVAENVDFLSVSSDEQELYYTRSDGVNGVFRATRTGDSGAFGASGAVTSSGRDPDVSHDGTLLLLARSGDSVEVIRRTCP